jgi:hypothetical protein
MNPQNSPFTTGYALGKSMGFKLGRHEGSEGHPINFERTGEFHQMKQQFQDPEKQALFVEGYRSAWKPPPKPR